MKRKIFTLMVAACASVAAFATSDLTVAVAKTNAAIVLDGVEDEAFADVTPVPIALEIDGATPTLGTCTWKALWSDAGIYVVVSVEDNEIAKAPSAGDNWKFDKPEVYFDVNDPLVDNLGAVATETTGHSQFAPGFEGEEGVEVALGDRKSAYKITGTNYVFEYFTPFSFLDLNANGTDYTQPIGFDVTVIDTDVDVAQARTRIVWSNPSLDGAESWANMDGCGTITLTGYGDAVSSVNSVKASAYVSAGKLVLKSVSKVSIYDVTGKLVAQNVTNGANLSALKSGLYLVKGNNFSAKIIK